MITIKGNHDSEEHRAAVDLHHLITQAWQHVANRPNEDGAIIAGVKCYGQQVVDIDLVVLISFAHPHDIGTYTGKPLAVSSLCLTIEVKNHSPENVRFVGNQALVKYRNQDHWHDTTNQSFNQQVALRNYLQANGLATAPYTVNLIWFRQIPESALPNVTHNIIGSDVTWQTLVERVATIQNPWQQQRGFTLTAAKNFEQTTMQQALAILTKPLVITPLDRKKIETITHKVLLQQGYVDQLIARSQLLMFRGRGGTGKTVRLLQIAHQLYQEQGARVLILTYNRALVTDIRRLFGLMGITQGLNNSRITIRTVQSFMYRVLLSFKIITENTKDFLTNYEDYISEMSDLTGAITQADIAEKQANEPETYSYDYLMGDEVQDWPPAERDILYALYDYRQFVLAYGYDQLVRGQQETDWRETIPRNKSQVVALKQSLRLKAGLSGFVSSLAAELGITDWNVLPNQEVYGGRVIIVAGAYTPELHARLLQEHMQHKNKPIDMLVCVPPPLATQKDSGFATTLYHWGYAVWDGTRPETRNVIPSKETQHRIVQYDSCRGLEGWTAVLLGLDTFYTYKMNNYIPTEEERNASFFNEAEAIHTYAARWIMIPLTRAIDTLVIQLDTPEHRLRDILWEVAQHHRDIVEWVE